VVRATGCATLSVPQRRSAIVSWAAVGIELRAIAWMLCCSVQTVRCWVKRNGAHSGLEDGSRPGRPAAYLEQDKLRIVAFYCQTTPMAQGGRWSMRVAARQLHAVPGIVGVSPSKSTIGRILKSNKLKPHLSRYFLHITDPDFFPKMEHLIALYMNPPRNLFFFDECPGIQVLSRLVPDMQTEATRKRLEEFEYVRNGTLDVFAFLHQLDGKVYVECHADHTGETLLRVFRRHVERCPAAEPLHYVMDNLSTHVGYPFCKLVAELRGVECPSERELDNVLKRAQWLGQENSRIVIHYTPYHGSWLNSVENWFGIMGAKVLHEAYAAPDHLKDAICAFGDFWNQILAHPFRWTYDGKGLHDKAVKRFIQMLTDCAEKLEVKTLTKLLALMTNLLQHYCPAVPAERWHQLAEAVRSRHQVLCALIEQDQRPQRKERARLALATLTDALSALKPTLTA
jgi:transposase